MNDIEKYYANTANALPNNNAIRFISMKPVVGNAVDLGCGAGRDTIYLIKNDWNVLAIDREDTEKLIIQKLNKKELEKFKFQKQNFENLKLEQNDLIIANFSIPFCNKNNFDEMWNQITNSISPNRIFRRKLLRNQ